MAANGEKLALIGLDRVAVQPVSQNDSYGYKTTGEVIPLREVTQLARSPVGNAQDFYSDDQLYLRYFPDSGIEVTFTYNEMGFETMAALGFGIYDDTTGECEELPNGSGMSFALSYRQKQPGSGKYRMFKNYVFTPSKVGLDSANTQTNSAQISTYTVVGILTRRKFDDKSGVIMDAKGEADYDWLDEFEAAGSAPPATP